jgi:hypothetical protein
MTAREVGEIEYKLLSIQRVIVTASLSRGCENAVPYAAELARCFNASL